MELKKHLYILIIVYIVFGKLIAFYIHLYAVSQHCNKNFVKLCKIVKTLLILKIDKPL